jgi:polyhydroxyalkanoate synthesis regulator phasin
MAQIETGEIRYLVVGAFNELRERAEKMTSDLVEKGKKMETGEKKARPCRDALLDREILSVEEITDVISRTMERFLGQMGLVTKSDMESLEKRLNSLEKKLDRAAGPARKTRAAKKS